MSWWETFFDADYLHLWESARDPETTEREVTGLWTVLGLAEGSRVVDGPCGYGRISRGLAARGARVLGVDFSSDLLAEAERRRGDLTIERLEYRRHDLRTPLPDSGFFDVALNIYSSLGYGTEADDLAVLSALRNAVRPGGFVFIETMHRDRVAVGVAQNQRPAHRLPDGTIVMEEPRFDAISGRMETTWYWSGPGGSGQKSASIRVYTATELVRLLETAGLRFRSVHNGCSPGPCLAPGAAIGNRLGLLAQRESSA
jgi:SAM-dependent methyltransferase